MARKEGYRKGDEHAGGGGGKGGGGKKGRPQRGWEKGDLSRDMDVHDPTGFQIAPGRDRERKSKLVAEKRRRRKRP